jgi:hypothetical protein
VNNTQSFFTVCPLAPIYTAITCIHDSAERTWHCCFYNSANQPLRGCVYM